jgi:hypothetical protein
MVIPGVRPLFNFMPLATQGRCSPYAVHTPRRCTTSGRRPSPGVVAFVYLEGRFQFRYRRFQLLALLPRNMRHTPMAINTGFFPNLMWNSRFASLSGDPFNNSSGFRFPDPEGVSLSDDRCVDTQGRLLRDVSPESPLPIPFGCALKHCTQESQPSGPHGRTLTDSARQPESR